MSVASHLGLSSPTTPDLPTDPDPLDPDRDPAGGDRPDRAGAVSMPMSPGGDGSVLATAARRWPRWQAEYPVLAVVEELADLPGWVLAVDASAADEVLAALARLACPTGGDDVTATAVLVWLLLPGAGRLAGQLAGLSRRIDEVVAAHLWVQARTIGDRRRRLIAANVLRNTRREVLRDLGVTHADLAWARTRLIDPTGSHTDRLHPVWQQAAPSSPPGQEPHRVGLADPGVDLDEVDPAGWLGQLPPGDRAAARLQVLLARACTAGVITTRERDLLLAVADAAHDGGARVGPGWAGVTSAQAAAVVGPRFGWSARTVRRRAVRALTALHAAATTPIPATAGRPAEGAAEKVPA